MLAAVPAAAEAPEQLVIVRESAARQHDALIGVDRAGAFDAGAHDAIAVAKQASRRAAGEELDAEIHRGADQPRDERVAGAHLHRASVTEQVPEVRREPADDVQRRAERVAPVEEVSRDLARGKALSEYRRRLDRRPQHVGTRSELANVVIGRRDGAPAAERAFDVHEIRHDVAVHPLDGGLPLETADHLGARLEKALDARIELGPADAVLYISARSGGV